MYLTPVTPLSAFPAAFLCLVFAFISLKTYSYSRPVAHHVKNLLIEAIQAPTKRANDETNQC